MNTIEIAFWVLLVIVIYTYIGYGFLLYILVQIKRSFGSKKSIKRILTEPAITILVAAYNEQDFVDQKIKNTRLLDYPSEKLHQIWVIDGSNDNTALHLEKYSNIKVLHKPQRRGKIAAINRAMKYIDTPIVIFSDANTLLGEKSVRKIAAMFENPKVGCVSGEKRIANNEKEAAASAGEGIYWKYESKLKQWDAELNSAVGAAGELFAIRTELFDEVKSDTILDDFLISLRIAMKGYTIQYDSEAYSIETASLNVQEELKRKIRIAAGGIQAIVRLYPLLNIFKYKLLSFQYISHRVLRWTITPLALPFLLIFNLILITNHTIFIFLAITQILFYLAALLGWFLERIKLKTKLLFVPYYFFIMNYAVYRGFIRFIKNSQSVNWERAKRANTQ
jgi:cellulose synthase/poly-beta-1,6-N-acetylglucosamine synthase-like glycosyltransferase